MASEPSKKRRRRSTVPVNHDAAIGRVARSWGHLEYMIDIAIWNLGNFEHQFGACVTSQISNYAPKIQAVIALAKLRKADEKLIKRLNECLGGLHGVAELRNRAVHDPRLKKAGEKTVYRWQMTVKGKEPVFGTRIETIEELHALSEKIREEIFRFCAIRDDLYAALLSSPPTPPLQLRRVLHKRPSRPRSSATSKHQRPPKP